MNWDFHGVFLIIRLFGIMWFFLPWQTVVKESNFQVLSFIWPKKSLILKRQWCNHVDVHCNLSNHLQDSANWICTFLTLNALLEFYINDLLVLIFYSFVWSSTLLPHYCVPPFFRDLMKILSDYWKTRLL